MNQADSQTLGSESRTSHTARPMRASLLLETDLALGFVIDTSEHADEEVVHNFLSLCMMGAYSNTLMYSHEPGFLSRFGDRTGTGVGGRAARQWESAELPRGFVPKSSIADSEELSEWKGHGLVCAVAQQDGAVASEFVVCLGDAAAAVYEPLRARHRVIGRVVHCVDFEKPTGQEDILPGISLWNERCAQRVRVDPSDPRHRPARDVRLRAAFVLATSVSIETLSSKHFDSTGFAPQEEEESLERRRSVLTESEDAARDREAKEAELRAVKLEMMGEIADARARPKDTTLFVFKLNPITKEEDLSLFFSRYGSVLSCNVARDLKTKASLGYAFVEFATREECETALNSTQNASIDGRRIGTDFSQSMGRRNVRAAPPAERVERRDRDAAAASGRARGRERRRSRSASRSRSDARRESSRDHGREERVGRSRRRRSRSRERRR